MKFIDMHTHIWPEKVAPGALEHLAGIIHVEPYTKGIKESLEASSREAGIDISVVLPVATKVKQFDSITKFALTMREGTLYSFGGIHPADEEYKEHLKQLKDLGFKGVKLHPDYQYMYFNDIQMKRIISYANELGLWVITHAGVDPISPNDVHCPPSMVKELIRDVRADKLILAHMGIGSGVNLDYFDEIIGEDVYLDTAYVLQRVPQELLIKALNGHNPDKIMFGTDSPWTGQKEDVAYFKTLDLDEELKEKIAWKNAARILDLCI